MTPDYHKVGLLAIRDGRILLCRKKHSTALLILPGGCYEPGESASQCLDRELREELGDVSVTAVQYLGTYTDQAAGEPGAPPKTVTIELYRGDLQGNPAPHAEIKELVWFGESDDPSRLAPSLTNKILPDLQSRHLLMWGGL
jgi:8-oxo-dGTP diphosphatase